MYVFYLIFVKWFNVVLMLFNYFLKLKMFVYFNIYLMLGYYNKLKLICC